MRDAVHIERCPAFFCAFVQYWIWYFGRFAVRNVSKWNSVHRLPATCHEDMPEHIWNEKHSFVGGVGISCIQWCRRMVNKKVPLSDGSGTFGVIQPLRLSCHFIIILRTSPLLSLTMLRPLAGVSMRIPSRV